MLGVDDFSVTGEVDLEQTLQAPVADDYDFNAFIKAQIDEMEKHKWFEGVKLGHNPLQDRTLNEIYLDWIEKYGADFRKHWENQIRRPVRYDECPECASMKAGTTCCESSESIEKTTFLIHKFNLFSRLHKIKLLFDFRK